MKQCVLIATWSGGEVHVKNLLSSLNGYNKYDIVIAVNDYLNAAPEFIEYLQQRATLLLPIIKDSFELGAIKELYDKTDYDEFIFFQDTIEVVNTDIFEMLFEAPEYKNRSVQYGYDFQMYLGKYRREILDLIGFPEIPKNKLEAIILERGFTTSYREKEPDLPIFNPDFADKHSTIMERFGRENRKLEDDYLIKWKGFWGQYDLE